MARKGKAKQEPPRKEETAVVPAGDGASLPAFRYGFTTSSFQPSSSAIRATPTR